MADHDEQLDRISMEKEADRQVFERQHDEHARLAQEMLEHQLHSLALAERQVAAEERVALALERIVTFLEKDNG